MVHVTTSNALDVVYDIEDGKQVIKGLQQHSDRDNIIPLPNPQGLVNVLQRIIDEIKQSESDNEVNARR